MLAATHAERQLPWPAPVCAPDTSRSASTTERAPYPEETSGPETLTDDHRPNEHTPRGVSTGDPILKVVILYRLSREDIIMVSLPPVVAPFHCPPTSRPRPRYLENTTLAGMDTCHRLDPGSIWTQETCGRHRPRGLQVICSSALSTVTTSMRVLPSLCVTVARKGDAAADVNYGVPMRKAYDAWCDQGYCATFELSSILNPSGPYHRISVTSRSSTTAKLTIPMLSTVCIGGANTRRWWSYNRFTLCTMILTTMTGSDIHHADRLR
ncbi:hypothetical protein B0H14DRAFT_3021196 [Mycena olivaceomarginata]|nr:hypothetical protein B0H14DRAFT_3021196 [Mycena olivaceomarginata]